MTDHPSPDLSQIWQDDPAEPGQAAARPAAGRPRKARARRATRPRRRRWFVAAGYGALVLACVCLAALAFLLVAAPLDPVRDRLIEQVKARTGRTLVVGGPLSLTIFPTLAVSLSDVSLSAPEGMEGAPTLVIPSLDAELSISSLMTWQVAVRRLTLHQPTIEFSVDAQGRRSWELASGGPRPQRPTQPDASDADRPASHSEPPAARESTAVAALQKLGLDAVRIVDGTLRYSDVRSGASHEIKSLDLTLTANDLAGPLESSGTLAWRGTQVTFAGTASPLRALLTDQPTQLAFKISGPPFEAAYEGTLALGVGGSIDGSVSIKASSVRDLGEWLGRSLPAGADADALAVSMHVTATRGQLAFSALQGALGDTSLAGSLAVDTTRERPHVRGNLQASELDFGRILVRPGKRATAPEPQPSQPPASGPPASLPANNQTGSKGWSEDAIDLPVLGLIDADLTLSAGRLVYKEVKTGQSRLSVSLKSGMAKVTLDDIELYNGRGRGALTLDGTGEVLVAGANLRLIGVSIPPLLTDALSFHWLDGRGNIALALAGQGLTERQIVETLNGKVDVAIANGAMTGIDIGKVVRTLQQGRLPSLTPVPEDRTPFSELSGTFTITNGVAKNQDLRLVSTHLRLSGEGTLDLAPRQIDYTVRAKVIGGPPAQGAVLNVGSLEIPVSIEGPWERPAFKIKGQEQLTGAVKQIGKNLKSPEVQDAIKGLLRGDKEQRVRPRELLEKLLKKD